MRLKYIESATFSQTIRIDAYLKEYESRMKIDYVISDATSTNVLTKAYTIQVAVDLQTKEMQFETPNVFRKRLMQCLEE